jgi:hypothetical protein
VYEKLGKRQGPHKADSNLTTQTER